MRRRFAIGAMCAVSLALAPNVGLAGPSGVLVSPPAIEGQAPETLTQTLAEGIEGGMVDAGIEVATAPESCADATCMAAEVAGGNARATVTARVVVTGSDYAMVVEVQGADGGVLSHQEGSCEICSFEEAAASIRALATKAAEELGPPAPSTGMVKVDSNPPGATVTLDGIAVGTTPYEGEVEEGAHTVALSLDGRAPAEQAIDVAAGATTRIDLALARQARISPKTTEIIGWAAIGVGVAALAGGITMLVLDENPVKSNCSGDAVDADGDCQFRYDTLGGGIGLTVAGALVGGGGAGLVVYSRKQQGPRGPAEVSLTPWGLRARF